jgi:hypothetical protein
MPYGFAAVALSTGLLLLKGSRIAPRNDRKPCDERQEAL